ncbi:O-antigen ligase family protein [Bordetella genomosp. 13]|uniref:O-antigen ligase family protein n=1 Tax=Bordetella genomosp. 13 TaxID=463040 RepID=UPI0011A3E9C3|nr:O-antigen ligase family protein [Bordetella genomosp. 13]
MAETTLSGKPVLHVPPRPAVAQGLNGQALQGLLITLIIALSVGFPLIRTTNLFATSTVLDTSYAEGTWQLPVVFGSVYLIAAWLLWMNRETAWRNLRAVNPFLLLMLAWSACSILWSPYPVTTFKRVVQIMGFIMVGLAIAPPVSNMSKFATTVMATFTPLLVICFFVSLLVPQVGVDYELGAAWRGIFWHKNLLGVVSAFTVVLWLRELRIRRLDWRLCVGAILFTLLMLVLARSTTSLITASMGSFLYLYLARRYLANSHVSIILVLGAACALMLLLHFFYSVEGRLPRWEEIAGPVASLLNKSTDLTGRTEIWQLVLMEVARHPWHGIGYGAFWLGVGGPSQYIYDAMHFIPLQAHSGYLDMLNELGIIGVALMVGFILVHARQLMRLMRVDRGEAAFHWAFFVLVLIGNISESILFRGVQFEYVWLICSSIIVSSRLRLHRHAQGTAVGAGEGRA